MLPYFSREHKDNQLITPLAALLLLKPTQKKQALIPAATMASGEKALLGGGSGAALIGRTGPSSAVPSCIQTISRTRLYFSGTDNCLKEP